MSGAPVTILLASYNGAAYLPAQLESIAEQTHGNWDLVVSDDGSSDGTPDIVRAFAAAQPPGRVRLIAGPRRGATRNFLHLLAHVPAGRAAAFCDQDDRWLPDKLARAMAAIGADPAPAHYSARTLIADHDLTPLTPSRRFARPLGLRNALVQAVMAGNASVFSAAAVGLLGAAAPAAIAADVPSHDWWAYQVTAAAGARLIHDATPCLLYRQHGAAEMGRNDTPRALLRRLGMLAQGDYGRWLDLNHRALSAVADLFPAESNALIARFGAALDLPGPAAWARLRQIGVYRQTTAGNLALAGAALAGQLRRRDAQSHP